MTHLGNKGETVVIGRVRKPVGLAGEVSVELFEEVDPVGFEGVNVNVAGRPVTIQKIRRGARGSSRVKLSGCETFEDANLLRNASITVSPENLSPLPKGKFYPWQLIGMTAKDQRGAVCGMVAEVMKTGGNDVYVVTDDATQREILVPAISAAVLSIDASQKVMTLAVENCMVQPRSKNVGRDVSANGK